MQNTVQDLSLPDCSSDSCPDLSWTSSFSSVEGSYDVAEAQTPTSEVPVPVFEDDVGLAEKEEEVSDPEEAKKPEEESTMSRRPQIIKITDSPNSTLNRRRPSRQTSALVATFAPTTAISHAETKCEFDDCDSRFRTLSCGRKGIAATRSLGRSAPDLTDDGKMVAFDGIVQYLQQHRRDLRELLVNNNVVIIEPVRSCRITGATVKQSEVSSQTSPSQKLTTSASNAMPPRNAFYHPQRRNRELVDEELPDPDTVRRARQLFESTLEMRTPGGATLKKPTAALETLKRWSDTGSLSSGVSSDLSFCDADATPSDVRSETDDASDCDDDGRGRSPRTHGNRVSREVLEKIRACGTSVTYYGGRVIQRSPQASNCTMKAVMDEIRESVHFRLVKSNSCGSRLELAGTDSNNNHNSSNTAKTIIAQQEPCSATKCTSNGGDGHRVTFGDMEFEEFEVLDEETPSHSHC